VLPFLRKRPARDARHFIAENRLDVPVPPEYVRTIDPDDAEAFEYFVAFCHRLVTDRDGSFTERHRRDLYERWARADSRALLGFVSESAPGLPSLRALNADETLIATSVVLPLTTAAYDAFCSRQLDALDIGRHHLAAGRRRDPTHLLVDILAKSPAVERLGEPQHSALAGSGLRYSIRHLAQFWKARSMDGKAERIVMCSTERKSLANLLVEAGFDDRCRQKTELGAAAVYRADLARSGWQPNAEIRNVHAAILRAIAAY